MIRIEEETPTLERPLFFAPKLGAGISLSSLFANRGFWALVLSEKDRKTENGRLKRANGEEGVLPYAHLIRLSSTIIGILRSLANCILFCPTISLFQISNSTRDFILDYYLKHLENKKVIQKKKTFSNNFERLSNKTDCERLSNKVLKFKFSFLVSGW